MVLVEPRNPLNIGAAARAMSNFGFTELRLVKPYEAAFLEARSAVRARYILEQAQVCTSIPQAVAGTGQVIGTTAAGPRDLHAPLYRLETAGSMIREQLAGGSSTALLFGSEKFGLSNADLSYCHWLLRIPTRAEHGSMNLGQAVAICLYELRREAASEAHRFPPPDVMGAEQSERLTSILLETLAEAGYVHERTEQSTERKLRRLVLRLGLPTSDAETWLGIFRQILWKLKR